MVIRMIKRFTQHGLCVGAFLTLLGSAGSGLGQDFRPSLPQARFVRDNAIQQVQHQDCPVETTPGPACLPPLMPGHIPQPHLAPAPTPGSLPGNPIQPLPGGQPIQPTPVQPTPVQPTPVQPAPVQPTTPAPTQPAMPPGSGVTSMQPTPPAMSPADSGGGDTGFTSFGQESASAVGGSTVSAANYIDSAVIRNQFRLRYDAQYDYRLPDRAELFYPKCGCFRTAGIDPSAEGPPLAETGIDSTQIFSFYMERAWNQNLSSFVELPIRLINPEQNANTSGLGDINFGFKYALINCPDEVLTFQFRTYLPTGDGDKGLGTEHVSLEPSVLYLRQLNDIVVLEAELRDWIAVGGSDFAGNVLRYGVGLSVLALDTCSFRIQPVVEFVGWTFLDGQYFDPNRGILDASGDTTINAKVGIRFGFGDVGPGLISQSTLAISYGRALTGGVLYEDIFRVELGYNY